MHPMNPLQLTPPQPVRKLSGKRPARPSLSPEGQHVLARYETYLRTEEDLRPPTVRNYLSDLRQFAAWCESAWAQGQETDHPFAPAAVATPMLTSYRSYLQTVCELQPATVNRSLVSLKRYFAWAVRRGLVARDPAAVVKLVPQVARPPRQVSDLEENALVAAVTAGGRLRDRTIVLVLLHTGLRASELCALRPEHVQLGKRSGTLQLHGKRNKYREVPLNATARAALADYLPTLPPASACLFPSGKTGKALTERAVGHLIAAYATRAGLVDVSPHDLRHRFGYRMAAAVPLHRLAQIMGHDSLDTTLLYVRGTRRDLQQDVETIAWR